MCITRCACVMSVYNICMVMGVMKMGNIVIMGIKSTSLAFQASVLPLHNFTHTYLSIQLFASEISADYYSIMCVIYML